MINLPSVRVSLILKDKLKAEQNEEQIGELRAKSTKVNENVQEAISGLMVLGYSSAEAKEAIKGATGSVEEIVKIGLKNLMRG